MVSEKYAHLYDLIIDKWCFESTTNEGLLGAVHYLNSLIEISNDPILKAKRSAILAELEAR